ncbi:hypothetical protein Trydic_g19540 [Trypoxylus dichotomus]
MRYPPLYAANDVVRSQYQRIRYRVAHEYTGEQHVAQFPTGRPDYRRIVMPDEDAADEHRYEDSRRAEGHGADRPAAVGSQVFFGDVLAFYVMRIGHCTLRTDDALGWIVGMANLDEKLENAIWINRIN